MKTRTNILDGRRQFVMAGALLTSILLHAAASAATSPARLAPAARHAFAPTSARPAQTTPCGLPLPAANGGGAAVIAPDWRASHRDRNHPPKGAEVFVQHATAPSTNGLPGEKDIPLLRQLGEDCDALASSTLLARTERGGVNARVALHQLGGGTNDALVIFIHGVLADCSTWRYLAGDLGRDHDLWVIDLPGCGHSEKPHPKQMEADGYSPTAMGERVLQALRQAFTARLADGRVPGKVTLSAHSLGGTVALRLFSDPDLRARYADVLGRIGGLVLMAPCDVVVHAEMPAFMQVVNLKGWQADVGEALGVVKSKTDQATRDSYHLPERALAEWSGLFRQVLTDGPSRRAAQAMLRQAVPWRVKEHRPDWSAIRALERQHANIDVPCVILWGEWDETLPVSMGHKLKDDIRGARLTKLSGCGHSIPSECPMESARTIRDFVLAMNPKPAKEMAAK